MTEDLADRAIVTASLYDLVPRDPVVVLEGAAAKGALVVAADAPALDFAALGQAADVIAVVVGAAPPVSASHVRAIAELAADAGFVLAEPELPVLRSHARTAADRAVIATIAFGTPRALLFVRAARAPKVVRIKEDRALDFQVALPGGPLPASSPGSLFEAAIAELAAGPMRGKDLLRAARGRLGSASAKDGAVLARDIVRAWTFGVVLLSRA